MARSLLLRWNLAYLATVLLHDLDHVRQGRPLNGWLNGVGALALTASIAATVLTATDNKLAPGFSVLVGVAGALGLVAVHVLPHWSVFSDPYPAVDADAVSWLSITASFVAATGMAIVGLRATSAAGVSGV